MAVLTLKLTPTTIENNNYDNGGVNSGKIKERSVRLSSNKIDIINVICTCKNTLY